MNHPYPAAQLNNTGVSSLLHHRYEEATEYFRHALSVMRADIHQQEQEYHAKPTYSVTVPQEDMLYESIDVEFYSPSRTHDIFQRRSGFQDPVICKMAINITSLATRDITKSLSSSVVFNLAVTTHLWGLHIGSTQHLQKALRLYEIVYRTHQGDQYAGSNTVNVVTTTLNNVASIHVVMGNQERANRVLQQLLAVMTYFRVSATPAPKHGQSWKICWGNVLTLMLGSPSATGAA